MEIIFDENQNDAFQGQNYPVFNLRTPEAVDFRQLQKQALWTKLPKISAVQD